MSGGVRPINAAPAEQFGAPRFELPLAGVRDRLMLRPVEDRSTAHIEKTGELSVRIQAEQLLYGGFGHVHGTGV